MVNVFRMAGRVGAWLSLFPLFAMAQGADPIRVESGLLAGMSGADPALRVYKGIPYAAPPVEALRWRAPEPPRSWDGVREAVSFAPGCIQHVAGSRPPWTEEFMHQGEISEDCLYLNVWTAAQEAGEPLPVLVYVHGGGFTEGSGSVPLYDGEQLAKKGLVVVTINYRLGVFGFLAHPELTAESERHAAPDSGPGNGDHNNGNQENGDQDKGNQENGDQDNENQKNGDQDNGDQNNGDQDNGDQDNGDQDNGDQDNASRGHGGPTNFGLLDQVAALQWVQRNIAAFGGDPDRVALAGQSAGAMSVYLLTASPLARGLFQRAIVQSGPGGLASFGVASTHSLARPLAEAEASGVAFAEAAGASSLEDLRAMSAEDLAATPAPGSGILRFGPVTDGHFLPEDAHDVYAKGMQNDVPMMTGFNADEASAFPGYGQATADAFREAARERYGEAADDLLALYPTATDEEAGAAQKTSQRDLAAAALGNLAEERAHTAQTALYLYYFDRGIPWPERPEFGAFHTAEVPYFFNNLSLMDRPWEALDHRLADTMASYWAHFAAEGDPNGDGLPDWPAFDGRNANFMRLGEQMAPDPVATPPAREFFRAFLTEE